MEDTPTYSQNIKLNSFNELLDTLKAYRLQNSQAHFIFQDNPRDRTIGILDEASRIRWYVTLTSLRIYPPSERGQLGLSSTEGRKSLLNWLNNE